MKNLFSFNVVPLVISAFVAYAYGIISKKPRPMSRSFPLCFLLGVLVSGLKFKS